MNEIRYTDVFNGCGGFRLGLQQADPRFKCALSCEIDPYAQSVYNYNFHESIAPEDITKIDSKSIPDIDFLCGGFPCQSFSTMGNKRGFEDARGTLFFELARILRDKKPACFLFENVKHLLHIHDGKTFARIISVLWDLGYDVEWQVLDTRDHGIPQRRDRVFITGLLRGEPGPKIFPLPGGPRVYLPANWASKKCREWFWGKHYFSTIARHYHKGPTCAGETYILTTTGNGLLRRLTPLECERIQGFPDGWTGRGTRRDKIISVADTRRYMMLGNAVSVPVIRDIGKKIASVM